MRFSKIELRDLGVCWIVLSLCFSVGVFFNKAGDPFSTTFMNFLVMVMATLISMGSGFIIHELCHKAAAQRFKCWAEFRTWVPGLVISVATALLSFGTFILFAPGAVHILAYRDLTKEEDGIISTAGPASNMALALVFLGIYSVRHSFGLAGDFAWHFQVFGVSFASYPYNIFTLLGRIGFQLNLWLAAFNLIPYGPLDGVKILAWNKIAWGALAAVTWGALILMSFGVLQLL
jgi:Zn-dependent protease